MISAAMNGLLRALEQLSEETVSEHARRVRSRTVTSSHPLMGPLIKTLDHFEAEQPFFEELVGDLIKYHLEDRQHLDGPTTQSVLADCTGLNEPKISRVRDILQQRQESESATMIASKQRSPEKLAWHMISILEIYTKANGAAHGKELVRLLKLHIFGVKESDPNENAASARPADGRGFPDKTNLGTSSDILGKTPLVRKEMDEKRASQDHPKTIDVEPSPQSGCGASSTLSSNRHPNTGKDGQEEKSAGHKELQKPRTPGHIPKVNQTSRYWSVCIIHTKKSTYKCRWAGYCKKSAAECKFQHHRCDTVAGGAGIPPQPIIYGPMENPIQFLNGRPPSQQQPASLGTSRDMAEGPHPIPSRLPPSAQMNVSTKGSEILPSEAVHKTKASNAPSAPRLEIANHRPDNMRPTPIVDFLWSKDQPVFYNKRQVIIETIMQNVMKQASADELVLEVPSLTDPGKKLSFDPLGHKPAFHARLFEAFERFRPSDHWGNERCTSLRRALEDALLPFILPNLIKFRHLRDLINFDHIQTKSAQVVGR